MLAFKEEIKYSDTVEINWWEKATLDGVIWKLLWLRRKSSTEFWKWEGGDELGMITVYNIDFGNRFPWTSQKNSVTQKILRKSVL